MKIYNRVSTRDKRKSLRVTQTDAESCLWEKIRAHQFRGLKFFRQYGIGEYIVDFYCPKLKLAIEIDGSQHGTEERREYDQIRAEFMKSMGIATVRFGNLEVLQNIEDVLAKLEEYIEKLNSPPAPPL